MKKISHHRGYALLLSVLTLSLLLSVVLGITQLIIKENALSAYLRESQKSFFSADRGMDCALFWLIAFDRVDLPSLGAPLRYAPFPTSTMYQYPPGWNSDDVIACGGERLWADVGWQVTNMSGSGATTRFTLEGTDGSQSVVEVVMNSIGGGGSATIRSWGYNALSGLRRTERTYQLDF